MKWLDDFLRRWEIARNARRENRLRALANSVPSFQWIIVRAGTAEQTRSPMLAESEIREWFREEFPNRRVIEIDNVNHILFYE